MHRLLVCHSKITSGGCALSVTFSVTAAAVVAVAATLLFWSSLLNAGYKGPVRCRLEALASSKGTAAAIMLLLLMLLPLDASLADRFVVSCWNECKISWRVPVVGIL
jgi:hypothetical protein